MSESALRLEMTKEGIGVLTLDQPGSRANTLGQAVLNELEGMVQQLRSRNDLRGLIFRSGKPGMFIAGADLKELGSMRPDPELNRKLVQHGHQILIGFEALPYPTVAAIEGACMGGGTELALAFDYRICSTHAKTDIGLPEVKVGLIPGWGGTQRLPRLIGPSLAAELICAGDSVNAERAKQLSIVFDAVPPERLLDEAVRLVKWAGESGDWQKARKRKQQPVGLTEEQAGFTFAVARAVVTEKSKGLPAPLAALTAIEKGCNLPLEEGLKVETEQFVPLAGSSISRNLIAVFFMGQRLAKDPGISAGKEAPAREVKTVGVIGAGLMGAGIVGAHIRRGIPAAMLDVSQPALDKGIAAITKVMDSRIAIGRMSQAEMIAALAKLTPTTSTSVLADRDVVIEAIVENEEAKTGLYRQLQPILKPDVILTSNTSTISISRMARAWPKPENFAGMHFFNPVDRMQLVEVIRGEQTSDETVVTLVALAKKIGKTPIVVRDCPGFLVNRILFPYLNEAMVLLEEGADPRAIDQAATAFGMPMGPVTLNDLVGNDTSLYAGRVVNAAFADRAAPTRILEELVAAGRLGQKSGAGFYSYAKGSRGADDPAFAALLEKVRRDHRTIGQEEITDRLFLPMLTEASRCLSEGIVRDPGDVDMGLILGIGFPAWRGGLLRWADETGLAKMLEKLKQHEPLGKRFEPTEQMRKLAAAGKGFYS